MRLFYIISLLLLGAACCSGQAFTYRDPTIVSSAPLVSLTIPTFVRAGTNSVSTGSTVTITSFDCSSGNYLVVGVAQKAVTTRTVSAMTCNSVAMTLLVSTNLFATSGNIWLYGLANPTTGNVVVSLNSSANAGLSIGAVLLNGVGSAGAIDAKEETALKNSISVAPSSVTTDLIVDLLGYQTLAITVSAGAGQTVQVSDALASTAASIFMGTQPGAAGSTTETYSASLTGSIMSLVAVALHGQ